MHFSHDDEFLMVLTVLGDNARMLKKIQFYNDQRSDDLAKKIIDIVTQIEITGSLCRHWNKQIGMLLPQRYNDTLFITSQRQVGFCLGLDGEGAPQPPVRLALGTGLAWLWLYCASLPPFCSVCTLFRCLSDCMWMLRLPLVVVE